MDRGAWQATVHGMAKSRTRQSRGSGAGTLGVPLEGTRRAGELLWLAGPGHSREVTRRETEAWLCCCELWVCRVRRLTVLALSVCSPPPCAHPCACRPGGGNAFLFLLVPGHCSISVGLPRLCPHLHECFLSYSLLSSSV